MRWTLALVVWLGCYAPHPPAGTPCVNGACPEGLVCSPATTTCELTAADAALRDGPPRDAAADARDAALDARIDAAPASPMVVQEATGYLASGASVSATLAAAPAAGHVLVMIGATPSGGLSSVTGGGATWSVATNSLTNSNIEVWYGVSDGSSATVTIARTNNASAMWLSVSEWSGLVTSSALDQATASFGSATTASAGSISTMNARDLVLFAVSAYAPNTYGTPGPGTWTPLTGITQAVVTQREWYLVTSATGSVAPSVSITGGSWEAAIAAFKIAP